MKKKYEKANIEIIELELDDVIKTSGLTNGNDWTVDEDTFAGGGIK